MASKKKYLYKLYKDGAFVGVLQNVISDFSYPQDINSGSVQLQVEIGARFESAGADFEVDYLVDEAGNNIVDEQGHMILTEKRYVFNDIPIDLANNLKVYLFYENDVNGSLVFDGLIESWESDYERNTILLTALSQGVKLQHYMFGTPPSGVIDSQTTSTGEYTIAGYFVGGNFTVEQTFNLAVPASLGGIQLSMRADVADTSDIFIEVFVFAGTPDSPGSQLGVSGSFIPRDGSLHDIIVSFSSPIDIPAGTDFFCRAQKLVPITGTSWYIGYNSAGGYASGQSYLSSVAQAGQDLKFTLLSATEGLTTTFNSYDPSVILRSIIDNFNQQGGTVTYDDNSIDNTNTKVTYTFKFSKVLDSIRKCLELAPGNWYWYVDPGTNLVHMHRRGTTADHTFIIGKHLKNLKLKYTLEGMVNFHYLSGGETGGVNLLVSNNSSISKTKYGQWLDTTIDNRVTVAATGNTLSRSLINQKQKPSFRTEIEIPAAVYDIETISIGQMVGFENGGDFVDSLLLQIVSLARTPDLIRLMLDTSPPTTSHRVEDIKRNLDAQQTINNPDSV